MMNGVVGPPRFLIFGYANLVFIRCHYTYQQGFWAMPPPLLVGVRAKLPRINIIGNINRPVCGEWY